MLNYACDETILHTHAAITSQLHVNYASYSILIITAPTGWCHASFKLRTTWSTMLLLIGAPIPNVVANTFSPKYFPWKIDVPLVLSSCGPYVLSQNVWHVSISCTFLHLCLHCESQTLPCLWLVTKNPFSDWFIINHPVATVIKCALVLLLPLLLHIRTFASLAPS